MPGHYQRTQLQHPTTSWAAESVNNNNKQQQQPAAPPPPQQLQKTTNTKKTKQQQECQNCKTAVERQLTLLNLRPCKRFLHISQGYIPIHLGSMRLYNWVTGMHGDDGTDQNPCDLWWFIYCDLWYFRAFMVASGVTLAMNKSHWDE